GSYDTYNYFPDIGQVVGSGDTDYFGGGLLSRLDFPTSSGAMYVEVSGRIGRSSNEYQSADLDSPGGGISKYSSTTPYYGVHVGVGHEFSFDEANSLDLYGKYLWTRQKGDDVTMSTGERISFDDVDSHRLKAGARYTRGLSPMLGVYGGAAYEHELDGKASAAVFGLPIEAPEMRGGTGVGELGLTINPMASGAVNLDLGVEGYVGKRRGVTGSLKVNFEF
ncbi:MAG: autotransporter outer membrane beta-barrel domain-containing protein, partial [Deltaproteobacteria bacterium]|nr:autotransporter outer membrane beta-barrel domain-containing protein [Deltaproteobacteria bacterium]